MIKCAWIRKRLLPYLNGELGRRGRSGVEKHLEECPGCRREYQAEKNLKELLASGIRREPEPLLTWEKIRPALEREVQEAERESSLARIGRKWRTTLEVITLPKTAMALAEAAYWGKRATVPVAAVLLALVFYHAFQAPSGTGGPSPAPVSGPELIVLRINFGAENAPPQEGFLADAGHAYSSKSAELSNAKPMKAGYGWRREKVTVKNI